MDLERAHLRNDLKAIRDLSGSCAGGNRRFELVHDVNRSRRERLKGLLRIKMNIDHLSEQVEVISSRCAQMMLGQLFECITSGLNPLNTIIIGLVNRFDQQAQGLV